MRDEWKDELDLVWFVGQHQSLFFNLVTSKSDNRIFSTEWLERISILIPDYKSVQVRARDRRSALISLIANVRALRGEMRELLLQRIDESKFPPIYTGVVSDVLDALGGNSGLTDQFIYQYQPTTSREGVDVLSGATTRGNKLGTVSRNASLKGKKLKIVSRESILLSRKGYAGVMTYLGHREIAINDDAYLLVPKKSWEEHLNLRWFSYQYALPMRACVSSQSDNSTFNKEWLDKLPVLIPEKVIQDRLAIKVTALQDMLDRLNSLEARLSSLLRIPIREQGLTFRAD